MANLNLQTVSIDIGRPNKLNDNGLVAGTGDLEFFIPAHKGEGCDFTGLFVAQGTLTGLTCSLQVSVDNGVTYADLVAAGSFLSAAAGLKEIVPATTAALIGGLKYRIHITAFTGSADFYVAVN